MKPILQSMRLELERQKDSHERLEKQLSMLEQLPVRTVDGAYRERILAFLRASDGGQAEASQIREHLGATSASFFSTMSRLVKSGVVRRVEHGLYALPETELDGEVVENPFEGS